MSVQPVRQAAEAVKLVTTKVEAPRAATPQQALPPVIPTDWLSTSQQLLLAWSVLGLIECIKVWEIAASYLPLNPEPTWSSTIRVQGPWSALGWTMFELVLIWTITQLRIPSFSPRITSLALWLGAYNLACYLVAIGPSIFGWISIFGPPTLGAHWYSSWYYLVRRMLGGDEHLSGVHRVRILPYSTATLNPMSLSYCIPPDAASPVYIPIVFNNSEPSQVSYFVRSLETGESEVKTIGGSRMKRSTSARPLALMEGDEEEGDYPSDPLSALVKTSTGNTNGEVARIPSVKPADSLAIIPSKLSPTEHLLFIAVERPSLVTLKAVVDRRGDKFVIAPHREAVIIECPIGGDFVHEKGGKVVKKGDKRVPAEQRCIGEEEIINFQVRGVGSMKAAWKKRSKSGSTVGLIEGIESDVTPGDELGLIRRDKVARTHTVPLKIQHDTPGVYTVSLISVSDSMLNSFIPTGPSAERSFDVQSRPSVKFTCPRPVMMKANGSVELVFSVESQSGGRLGDVEVAYEYNLADGSFGGNTVKTKGSKGVIVADRPGVYTLVDVTSTCAGRVLEPASCRVELIPVPTVEMGTKTLHECAMDVGFTVSFDFTGTPPFVIDFTEQRDKGRSISRRHTFDSLHGELTLLPDQEGRYTYSFTSLQDKHYKGLPISYPPITQTIHPLATVDLAVPHHQRRKRFFACSPDLISLDVEAKGRGPLTLNYLASSQLAATGKTQTQNITVEIPDGRSKFDVHLPDALLASSGRKGTFDVALLSITDGNGCTRRLNPAPSYEVVVDRERPTGRMARSDKMVLVEGQQAKANLRLTGTPPWEVTYAMSGGVERTVTMRDPNNALVLQEQGRYRLIRVKDAHCGGDIIEPESTFEIVFKPRPKVSVVPSSAFTERDGVLVHRGLCQEQEDQVAFRFEGEAPFELTYRHTRSGQTSRHVLKSAQTTGILHLSPVSGSHRYDILEVRDANYASTPIGSPMALMHDVNSRPSVNIARANSQILCLDSALHGDAHFELEGVAPFNVQLSVRRPTSVHVATYDVVIDSDAWTLDVPQHILKEVGRHEVTITSLSDASGCEWVIHDLDRLSTSVEVVESARIVARGTKENLCVGETLEFELQGTAPWNVEYTWNGKKDAVTSSASRFVRLVDRPGHFAVTSVSLKDDQCKRQVSGLDRRVHPLPSARLQDGENDLHEGDEPAVFTVRLKGTAPFSFTYTRSEIGTNGRRQVVETQTISDVWENSYTISSSLPGEYAVTSVSDKFCHYPPPHGRKSG